MKYLSSSSNRLFWEFLTSLWQDILWILWRYHSIKKIVNLLYLVLNLKSQDIWWLRELWNLFINKTSILCILLQIYTVSPNYNLRDLVYSIKPLRSLITFVFLLNLLRKLSICETVVNILAYDYVRIAMFFLLNMNMRAFIIEQYAYAQNMENTNFKHF